MFLKEKFRNLSQNNLQGFVSNIKGNLIKRSLSSEDPFILSQSDSFFALELNDIYNGSFILEKKIEVSEKCSLNIERTESLGLYSYYCLHFLLMIFS